MPLYPAAVEPLSEKIILTFDPIHSPLLGFANANGIGVNSVAWPAANLALFSPVYVWATQTLTQLVAQWNTTSGNVDIGIYDSNLTKIVSSGSTAASGLVQQFNVADTVLTRGTYYVALAADNTTLQVRRGTQSVAAFGRMLGMFEQASAFPLPATATPAAYTRLVLPICGYITRASL